MRLGGLAEAICAILAGVVLAFINTYPLITKFTSAARLDSTDGRWSVWVVSWVAHALTTDPLNVYRANIFYPHDNALAFSEANLVEGALGVPAWLLTQNPMTTHNSVFVLSFVLSFVATYYLVRHLVADRRAAAVAGVLYAFCPYVFGHFPHIQLLMIGGLPVCLLAFHRFEEHSTTSRALVLGVSLWLMGLTCAYYGLFAGGIVALGSITLAFAHNRLWDWQYWRGVAIAAIVCVGLTVPFFLPYLEVQQDVGFSRTLTEAYRYSANAGAWLASAAWAHSLWLPYVRGFTEVLFPGIVTVVFGVAGAWIGLTRLSSKGKERGSRIDRGIVVFYVLTAVVSFWIALGPAAGLYTLLYRSLPIVSMLRAPARTGVVVALCLVVLASVAMARLLKGQRRATLLGVVLFVLASADLFRAPVRMQDRDPLPPAQHMLARLPAGPVAEFPFWYERLDYHRHAYYMLNSTVHWQPMVNGYSDVIPQDFRDNARPLSSFPDPASFDILERIGARYALFHLDSYDERSREKLLARLKEYEPYLRPLHTDGELWLFEIVGFP
ncbi:MAG: DUF6044 family protein [Vicinamibacterales bacterium]